MLRFASGYIFRPGLALGFRVPRLLNIPRAGAATLASDDKPQLRDYQLECIDSVLSSLDKGHKRVGISLATGSGKTVVFTQLIDKIKPRPNDGDRTLILAHRRELVEQAAHGLSACLGRGRHHRRQRSEHHVQGPARKALKHFGLGHKQQDSPTLIGVSATFSRFDGLKLGVAIDEIVFHRDYVDMISDNWLSNVIFTTVRSSANLSQVKRGVFGDFHTGELSQAVNTHEVNELTVRSWMTKASDRKSTLVFCVDLAHVSGLTHAFRQHQIDARFVTGDTPKVERSETLDAFKRGDFPILVNCGVFTEGTDIPNVDCIVLARPTRSRNLLVQMIGRGMRLHPGKDDCHVIDLVSSLETGIITTPTLFGLDPSELVDKASVGDLRVIKERKSAEEDRARQAYREGEQPSAVTPGPASVTFTDYASVFDLIADTNKDKYIRTISPYCWVRTGEHRHVLVSSNGDFLRIERVEPDVEEEEADETDETDAVPPSSDEDDGLQQTAEEGETSGSTADDAEQGTRRTGQTAHYRTVLIRSLRFMKTKAPYSAPHEILKAATFADAVHGSDSYASKAFPHVYISLNQPWRKQRATPAQVNFLNRFRSADDQLRPEDISKGKAMDMMTKFKHGARGEFRRIKGQQRKLDRKAHAEAQRKARERVQVGPVQR
ncbi:hypothetical protein XA68_12997 [Ophiocordyceps unilateralis]|uniref:Helicase C-terminal domain-containing protein n=1 Tax=Ophiocordyceps unilateralis TaxID=268505 RepID=A0A2A9PNW5_OPHUN|nr:hypothetical protein XA68_12997 [Ophiocordyceps unilateralis]